MEKICLRQILIIKTRVREGELFCGNFSCDKWEVNSLRGQSIYTILLLCGIPRANFVFVKTAIPPKAVSITPHS